MGTTQSRLQDISVEEISSFVTNLGDKYHEYGKSVSSNAVDGELLMEIEDVDEFKETLRCLDITNFLHQKVLTKEWKKAKTATYALEGTKVSNSKPAPATGLQRSVTVFTNSDASELTMETGLSTSQSNTQMSSSSQSDYCRRIEDQEAQGPLISSLEQRQSLEALDIPRSIDVLPPGDPFLEPFHQLASQALGDLKGSFAQVNILDAGVEEGVAAGSYPKGINNLATAMPATLKTPMRLHFAGPDDLEICRTFILGSDEDFHLQDVPMEVSSAFGMTEATTYYGHVVKFGNHRVGTVCVVIEETPGKETDLQEKQELLKSLAAVVKGQLEKRAALVRRSRNLKEDLRQIKEKGVDPELAPPLGPVRAVTASQVAQRETIFPYPQEPGQHPNGCPTEPQFTRRSATLPFFQATAAKDEDRLHLQPTYYQDPKFDTTKDIPMDLTPIGERDMEQVALLQSLQLLQMDPLCKEAEAIQSLVDLAGKLLKADFACINLLTQEHGNLFFMTYLNGSWPAMEAYMETYKVIQSHPRTGEAFHRRGGRAPHMCNYAMASPRHQSFVVHNIEADQSVACMKSPGGMSFYSGSPIVVQGTAVGCLCLCSRVSKPEFGRIQEIQQEQFAQLIAQEYETWALNNEIQQLERERNLFLTPTSATAPISPPEDYAALVFTSVQGAAALLETNAEVMERALGLHSQILDSQIAECGGYRVTTESTSNHVAFADVGDAVQFCLKTQEALHAAPWEEDILALLPHTQDVGAFRGLRVKMAVHCGEVESKMDAGRTTYSGETFHIASNLESMAHGGQILITSDVWNVAAYLVGETISTPQVIDLGSHVVPSCSKHMKDGITTKSILQLVPTSLSHDYLQGRVLAQPQASAAPVVGRTFPRIKTKKSVSASFHDAPFADNNVSLVHVDTSHVETMSSDPGLLLAVLSKRVSAVLREEQPDGYQCKDFLVAFEDTSAAVRFGLALQESLGKEDVMGVSLKDCIGIGVHQGNFETMGPNPVSGKAEYFGNVIERVKAVARSAAPGSVVMGKVAEEMDAFNLQPITNGFMLDFAGTRYFEGINEDFSIYRCHPCKSWYDQMVDNRNGRSSLQSRWRGNY